MSNANSRGATLRVYDAGSDAWQIQWTFPQSTAGSFVWRGEGSLDGGATWRLDDEFLARRI